MKIFINSIEKAMDFHGNSLGELLDQIQKNTVLPGTYISTITLDGKSTDLQIESDQAQEFRALLVNEIGKLEIEIVSVQEIVNKNLDNAELYLEKLIPGIEKAAELFQVEDETEANKFFLNIIDGIEWLSQVLDGVVSALNIDIENNKILGRTVHEHQAQLIDLTQQLVEANTNKDWVLVADLLEYEILPFYREWSKLIPEFRKILGGLVN
jgi:hypothetical protein